MVRVPDIRDTESGLQACVLLKKDRKEEMLKRYRAVLKKEGWRGLIRKEGWKVGILLFMFFFIKGLLWLAAPLAFYLML